jgi:hypothetical protein
MLFFFFINNYIITILHPKKREASFLNSLLIIQIYLHNNLKIGKKNTFHFNIFVIIHLSFFFVTQCFVSK